MNMKLGMAEQKLQKTGTRKDSEKWRVVNVIQRGDFSGYR